MLRDGRWRNGVARFPSDKLDEPEEQVYHTEGHPAIPQLQVHIQRRLGTLHCQRRPGGGDMVVLPELLFRLLRAFALPGAPTARSSPPT